MTLVRCQRWASQNFLRFKSSQVIEKKSSEVESSHGAFQVKSSQVKSKGDYIFSSSHRLSEVQESISFSLLLLR